MPTTWHTLSNEDIAQQLHVDVGVGLSDQDVLQRRLEFGSNEIIESRQQPWWRIVLKQFNDFMIIILLLAAVISGWIGDPVDTWAILVIVLLNAIIGATQEFRAQRAVAALRAMAAPTAHVRRNGRVASIASTELVPGDIVLLEAGNIVPADLRVMQCADLEVNESALTGESVGVLKQSEPLASVELALGDQINLAFKGTQVNRGRSLGIVVATGMQTQLGRIADMLRDTKGTTTPLQKRMTSFGKRLALAVLGICLVIFLVGMVREEPIVLMFLTVISLAVAAIPEALPAVISVTLALGARKLSRHRALIRHLPAVETLGSVTYICSDKTGTLTQNKMHVEALFAAGQVHPAIANNEHVLWQRLGEALALNNDVTIKNEQPSGDPTELALYLAAQHAGFHKQDLEQRMPRVAELAFDSERKRMTTVHRRPHDMIAFVKGAPEQVLRLCKTQLNMDGIAPLDEEAIIRQAQGFAGQAYRVMAIAMRQLSSLEQASSPETIEQDLCFLGLVAMIDPPREEAAAAVQECLAAGITPVMITGDHPATALAIAARLGIADHQAQMLDGEALARLSADQLQAVIKKVRVYARVSPQQKIRIVQALQQAGEFCAMTGDGVNDAPALKFADIGVAMGQKGTDVAREAADMVLLDDNFATIVTAVREGRRIFDNIRKFIKYTMTSNSGEIWTLLLAPLLGLPIPLLPIHILWINLVTDGLPGLALSVEPAERGIMQRPPRPPQENIFAHGMWQHIVWIGLLIGAIALMCQAWAVIYAPEHWQTMVFTVLTFSQLAHVLVIRSETQSLLTIGVLSNLPLLGAVMLTVLLQLAVIYLPALNEIFKTAPLNLAELAVCFMLSLVVVMAVEIEKALVRRNWIYRQA